MEPERPRPESLRAQQIAFGAMALGVAVAAGVFALIAPIGDYDRELLDLLFFGGAGVTLLAVIGAYMLQQRLPEALAVAASYEEAAEILYRRSIFSVAAAEVPAMLGLVGFLLSADQAFLLFLAPFVVVLVVLFPTSERVEQRLKVVRGSPRGLP